MNAQLESFGLRHESATPERWLDITRLLAGAGMQVDDLTPANLSGLELALDGERRIVGIAGLDVCDGDALLRSVAVVPEWRGKGVGETLVVRREAIARVAGVDGVYLLTTTADGFFRRLGYVETSRDAVPAPIAAHAQFRSLCPASARCLGKRL